jgi:hypothetical protein
MPLRTEPMGPCELPLYGVLRSSAALKFLGEGGPGGAPVDR